MKSAKASTASLPNIRAERPDNLTAQLSAEHPFRRFA
jgi:hypothetical protein